MSENAHEACSGQKKVPMSKIVTGGDKELLAAMVAATLQDLRPPKGLSDDPMPGKDADPSSYQAWIKRHTAPQREGRKIIEDHFFSDAIYDHYTARAVLNGMPFDARGQSFTLQEALLNLGVNDPQTRIAAWKEDFAKAADVGDRMMNMVHQRISMQVPDEDDDSDLENEAETALPYQFEHTDRTPAMDSSQMLN
jgi:hypothetical protein